MKPFESILIIVGKGFGPCFCICCANGLILITHKCMLQRIFINFANIFRMTDAAIRCTILCTECLKQIDNYGESASILIRMTSEECDLRSALFLEQAAYSFLKLNSPRKYALHSVLAGNKTFVHKYSIFKLVVDL